jgi:hypothetical protein
MIITGETILISIRVHGEQSGKAGIVGWIKFQVIAGEIQIILQEISEDPMNMLIIAVLLQRR